MNNPSITIGTDAAGTRFSMVVSYGWLLLLGCILGSNFMMTKLSVQSLPPMFVVSFRLAVASVILTAIMLAAGYRFPRGNIWWPILGSALIGHVVPFSLLAWGQQSVDAGLAAILMATMPLFTLLLAQIFTQDEKPNRYSIAGFTVALAGIVLLFGVDKLASLADRIIQF